MILLTDAFSILWRKFGRTPEHVWFIVLLNFIHIHFECSFSTLQQVHSFSSCPYYSCMDTNGKDINFHFFHSLVSIHVCRKAYFDQIFICFEDAWDKSIGLVEMSGSVWARCMCIYVYLCVNVCVNIFVCMWSLCVCVYVWCVWFWVACVLYVAWDLQAHEFEEVSCRD